MKLVYFFRSFWRASAASTVLAALAASTAVYAHTPLQSSSPAPGASVGGISAIALKFNGPVRLVRLRILRGDEEIPLGFTPNPVPAASYEIAAPNIPAGEIAVEWAAISGDGHTITDTFSFTLDPGTGATAAD